MELVVDPSAVVLSAKPVQNSVVKQKNLYCCRCYVVVAVVIVVVFAVVVISVVVFFCCCPSVGHFRTF